MVELPQASLLSLRAAVTFVAKHCMRTPEQAKHALLDAFKTGKVIAEGHLPLNAHPDSERAWAATTATKLEAIGRGVWSAEVDWRMGTVGRYREITVEHSSIEQWLKVPSVESTDLQNIVSAAAVATNNPAASGIRSERQRSGISDEEFARDYIAKERAAKRKPTQLGLVEAAKSTGRKGGRDRLRAALREILGADAPNRGRPSKSPR